MERRAKIHFRRDDPIAGLRLAEEGGCRLVHTRVERERKRSECVEQAKLGLNQRRSGVADERGFQRATGGAGRGIWMRRSGSLPIVVVRVRLRRPVTRSLFGFTVPSAKAAVNSAEQLCSQPYQQRQRRK